jgi:hypothetical protein
MARSGRRPQRAMPGEEEEDADNEDDDEKPETVFETHLGGGVTLQRIPAKTNRSEGGKVGGVQIRGA